ncbi:hypothetical protein QR680_000099 [Steinernema hermaphroditum]|uniref:Uncharacterized protein n=1 Tax=Steinernema hermaphroditum TaxID=289476 RepID=A0AA39LDH6_9BILA|nr:hypothetical protein QR680_000099 [Steinernema hermaphroditum]
MYVYPLRKEAMQLLETCNIARQETKKQTALFDEALSAEVDFTLAFLDKVDAEFISIQNMYPPSPEVDDEAFLQELKKTVQKQLDSLRSETDMSKVEAKFEQMCTENNDEKELEDLTKRVMTKLGSEFARLKEEKERLEKRMKEIQKSAEEREVRLVADKIILERREKKCLEALACLKKERMDLERNDEQRERLLNDKMKEIDDMKKEIDELNKIVERLKFRPQKKSEERPLVD